MKYNTASTDMKILIPIAFVVPLWFGLVQPAISLYESSSDRPVSARQEMLNLLK